MENIKVVSKSREGLNKAQIEAASELGTTINNKYEKKMISSQNSSIVKRLIQEYERNLIGK